MPRLFGVIFALCLLTACNKLSPAQQAQVQLALSVACNVDGAVVPIAQPVIAGLVPGAAGVVTLDQALVHPAVVQACATLGGAPASVKPVSPS